jgi:hypothetical protein
VSGVDPRNLLLTGLPRSGTTLTCQLLGSFPNTVALDEPLDGTLLGAPREPAMVAGGERRRSRPGWSRRRRRSTGASHGDIAMDGISAFLADTRASLRERGMARSKVVDGRVDSRKVTDDLDEAGLRIRVVSVGELRVDKPLTNDFLLVLKQNSSLVALLPDLAGRFRMHAVVRNPLAVLCSWQAVPFAIRQGHIPLAERLNPDLAARLGAIADPLDRQLFLLDWYFRSFSEALPAEVVTRYEDLIATSGRCLAGIVEEASSLTEPLENRNHSPLYDRRLLNELGRRLIDLDGAWWGFYSRDDVEAVMAGPT